MIRALFPPQLFVALGLAFTFLILSGCGQPEHVASASEAREMAADPRCTVDGEPICPPRELCPGPVETIADDDPGLALYPDGPLEERKIRLATNRGESFGPDDEGVCG